MAFSCLLSAGCGTYIFTFPINSEWFSSVEGDFSSEGSDDSSDNSSADSSSNSSDSSNSSSSSSSSNNSSSSSLSVGAGTNNYPGADGTIIDNTKSLNENLASGEATYVLNGTVTLEVIGTTVNLGGEDIDTLTVIGGSSDATVRVEGTASSYIHATNPDVTLVFKNVTFIGNETQNAPSNLRQGLSHYMFGGYVEFEDCTFNAAVCVGETEEERDTSVQFTDCQFNAGKENMYDVWICNGETSFEGCVFKGYRAVKIHESQSLGDFVRIVSFADCVFDSISVKPGISIGSLYHLGKIDATKITVYNSVFDACQAVDSGCVEGIDGFYESDVYTDGEDLDFTFMNVRVDNKTVAREDIRYSE